MSGRAAEPAGSRKFIHTKAMPSPGQYCWRTSSIYLFIQPYGPRMNEPGLTDCSFIYSYAMAQQLRTAPGTISCSFIYSNTPATLSSNPAVGHIRSLTYSSRYTPVASLARQPLHPPFIYSYAHRPVAQPSTAPKGVIYLFIRWSTVAHASGHNIQRAFHLFIRASI